MGIGKLDLVVHSNDILNYCFNVTVLFVVLARSEHPIIFRLFYKHCHVQED
jgi:hypothetical protein